MSLTQAEAVRLLAIQLLECPDDNIHGCGCGVTDPPYPQHIVDELTTADLLRTTLEPLDTPGQGSEWTNPEENP